MGKLKLILIIITFSALALFTVLIIVRHGKKKKMKRALEELEIEKNKLASSPIIPELAKVESFLNNEKLEVLYNEWTNRLNQIRETQIPKLSDMLLEAEYSLSQRDYKQTIYKIAKLEMELYKVRTNSDFLLGEIKEITHSEEKNRSIITKYRAHYRELYQKFTDTKSEYGQFVNNVNAQFEVIAKRFEDFESIMDNNEYTEVNKIVNIIDELLKHMDIVVEEVPSISLLAESILPKKINEILTIYNQMLEEEYPLDYLNVEYNVNEANTKINDIIERTKTLNLESNLFELKVLLDYFDSLFADFDNEKIARKAYDENNYNLKNRLAKVNEIVDDIFSKLDEVKNVYNLSDENIETLKEVRTKLQDINSNYKVLLDHTVNHAFAYSKLVKEVEGLSSNLSKVEEKLDNSLDVLGSMRDDEVRARQQLEEVKMVLKESKLKMRDYKLPVIPDSYFVELKEASSAIKEIIRELDKKPITIEVLNTRVDTARDLVLKLYTKTKDLLKTAMLAETAIVYGNRYRSYYDGVNKTLNYSEQLFYKGEYQKSLENSMSILTKIEPTIYSKIMSLD